MARDEGPGVRDLSLRSYASDARSSIVRIAERNRREGLQQPTNAVRIRNAYSTARKTLVFVEKYCLTVTTIACKCGIT